MRLLRFPLRSLKTKISFATLAIFLAGIWTLSLYASRILREDMQRQLGEQQLATTSIVAAQIDSEIDTRFLALQAAAASIGNILREAPGTLPAYLEQRSTLHTLFNGGFVVLDDQGVAIGDFPLSAGRMGVDYGDDASVAATLAQGINSVSKPIIGRKLHAPIFVMTTPIRGKAGRATGAVSGAIHLGQTNFLDKFTEGRHGRTGRFLLVDPRHRLIVTATNKDMTLQATPAAGINAAIDRFHAGFEGTTVFVDPAGVEMLASVKQIPSAHWYVIATLPTHEAFQPIRAMQHRVLAATLLLSLCAGALTWWIVRRQMSPVLDIARQLAAMADKSQALKPLPVTREDEIGMLVKGFNRLLASLEQREALLKNILDTSSVAIFLVDNQGRITRANRCMGEMFGRPVESLVGDEYVALIHPSERTEGREKMLALMDSEIDYVSLDRLYWRGDRSEFWGHLTGQRIFDTAGQRMGLVGVIADIDQRKRAEAQLVRMAHFDPLTGLPNRALLADRLHQAMAHTRRHNQRLAIAYLDLDGFKAVNDNYGHESGDRLLITLAQRMKSALREGDTLARLGGDEFVAVFVDAATPAISAPMLERLLAAASQTVTIDGTPRQITGSLGVTFYPQAEEVDADQLLRQADQAMYQAKLAGKNRFALFDTEQDRTLRGHHESLQRIQEALVAEEFVLHFQPKVNMRTGTIVGAEALIRWQHPEKGLLAPSDFLPAADDHALSIDIGEWVIDKALQARAAWRAAGLDIPISVNIGARQLQHPDFVTRLQSILERHPGLRHGDLEFEILETSALEDLQGISQVIRDCLVLGVTFALDDFGTGYSSLTYLKRLPFATLKIDQSFVRDMLDNPDDLFILESVVSLAAAFGRTLVAEGVETVEHGRLLLQLDCPLAQGYGIARPMPASELPAWAVDWQPDAAWLHTERIDKEQLHILAAGIEHRAWVAAMLRHIKGDTQTEPPESDPNQCHFGRWLNRTDRQKQADNPRYSEIAALHRQIHRTAAQLDQRAESDPPLRTALLDELQALSETLSGHLAELSTLKTAPLTAPDAPSLEN